MSSIRGKCIDTIARTGNKGADSNIVRGTGKRGDTRKSNETNTTLSRFRLSAMSLETLEVRRSLFILGDASGYLGLLSESTCTKCELGDIHSTSSRDINEKHGQGKAERSINLHSLQRIPSTSKRIC